MWVYLETNNILQLESNDLLKLTIAQTLNNPLNFF